MSFFDIVRFHSSYVFGIDQSFLVEFGLCAPIRLVFFDIGHLLLVDFDSSASTRLVFFDIGHLLLMNFDLCASTRLVFLTLLSHCWWTLTGAIPLVLFFSHWTVTVGGFDLCKSVSSANFQGKL